MRPWPRNSIVNEIDTWVWLGELSRKHQRPVELGPCQCHLFGVGAP
jgi:hypothetical protein